MPRDSIIVCLPVKVRYVALLFATRGAVLHHHFTIGKCGSLLVPEQYAARALFTSPAMFGAVFWPWAVRGALFQRLRQRSLLLLLMSIRAIVVSKRSRGH